MANLKSPYTKQLSVYNPQRSAGTGIRSELPEQYSLGYRGTAGGPVSPVSPVRVTPTVDNMIYSPPANEGIDGPGNAGYGPGGNAEGLVTGTTDPTIAAQNANLLGLDSPLGLLSYSNPALAIGKLGLKGLNSILGDPWGKAKDLAFNALGLPMSAQGDLNEGGKTMENALNAITEATPQDIDLDVDLDVDMPSSLSGINIGGDDSGYGDPSANAGDPGGFGGPAGGVGTGGDSAGW